MIRQIVTVSSGTLASRVFGFARDAVIAALLGAGAVADAFLFAFQLVNVARRLLNEGALNAALVPAWLRIRAESGPEAATAFAGQLVGTLSLLLILLAIALGFAMPIVVAVLAPGFQDDASYALAIENARLMLPYLAFAAPVAVIAGVLNARHRYGFTAASPLLFNLTIIAVIACLMLAAPGHAVFAATLLAVVIGASGVLQLALLASQTLQIARPIRISFDGRMRRFLVQALPGMIAQAGPQLLLVASSIVASASPAAVSWLYFASRLVELPLGVVGGAAGTVLISRLADKSATTHDPLHASSRAFELSLGLALPAAIGLSLLARPIVALLFERGAFTAEDGAQTAQALAMLALSLPGHVLVKMFSALFFARGDTIAPFTATLAGLAVTVLGGWLSFPAYGYLGVAAAYSGGASMTALVLGLGLAASSDLPVDRAARRNLAKIGIAAALMGILLTLVRPFLLPGTDSSHWWLAGSVIALVTTGLLSYLALLKLFGMLDFSAIRKLWEKS